MTRQNVLPAFKCNGDSCNGDDDDSKRSSDSHALVPLWDMFNHRHGKLSTDFENEKNSLICYSMSNFNAGDEIFIHYGDRANRDFFLHNGFVDVENDYDFVSLRLGISKSDPLAAQKVQLCNKLRIPSTGMFCLTRKNTSKSHLLAFLRVFHMSQGELGCLPRPSVQVSVAFDFILISFPQMNWNHGCKVRKKTCSQFSHRPTMSG